MGALNFCITLLLCFMLSVFGTLRLLSSIPAHFITQQNLSSLKFLHFSLHRAYHSVSNRNTIYPNSGFPSMFVRVDLTDGVDEVGRID
jgi:hypothetical protein